MNKSTLFLILSTSWIILMGFIHFKVTSLENVTELIIAASVGLPLYFTHIYYKNKEK